MKIMAATFLKTLCWVTATVLSLKTAQAFGHKEFVPRYPNAIQMLPQELQHNAQNKQVLEILQTKCNTCHRKKNPFMVFNEKNMDRRALKIEKQVFDLKRMPRKDGTPLTFQEYATLKSWIETLKQHNTKD